LLAWLITVPAVTALVVGSEKLREACLKAAKGESYHSPDLQERLHRLDHQANHGGNDVVALCTSFLLIQLVRFGLTRNLPNLYGEESAAQVESHNRGQITLLLLIALLGACFAGASYFIRRKIASPAGKRSLLTLQLSMAMAKSWCFFFAGVWIMGSLGTASALKVSEDSALLDVLLALALSTYSFALIFALDKLADAEFTDNDADAFIYTFMGGLGILIGFAWEQAFERSLETVVLSADEQEDVMPEPILKALLVFLIVILVLPAWRMYILKNALDAGKEGGMDYVGE
jgi:hypothetical protein